MSDNYFHLKRNSKGERPTLKPFAVINYILVDKSASMITFNNNHVLMNYKLLKEIQDNAISQNVPTYVSFISFDHSVEKLIVNQDIRNIKLPTEDQLLKFLKPHGTTRFIDTVIEAIDDIDTKKKEIISSLSKEVRNLNPKIVTILNCTTDGADNSSVNFTESDLKEKMLAYRKKNGECLLLTANLDAVSLGGKYGFNEGTSLTMDNSNPSAIQYAFDCVQQTSRTISDGQNTPSYTPLQRNHSISNNNDDDDEDDSEAVLDFHNNKIPFQPTCPPPIHKLRRT